jgi:tetratricopeptide (TPR) repeat protein
VELYPSGRAFIAASSLPAEAVETTGVIALSKWSRLLITSPRALGRGYGWKDTLAHEYIHEVVAWRTRDRAPVWLQEGIARSHEGLWRRPGFAPPAPLARSLLARALEKDALVPLKKMHPSMAFLESADEAALAYAQVDSMVQFLAGRAGEGGVARLLDTVRDGTDALQAWAQVAGGEPDAMMAQWRDHLGTLGLRDARVSSRPVALGAQDDPFATDPVLARRRDLAGHARLGDLLMEAGRADAALAEYAKAKPEDEPPSPTLVAREARALDAVGRRADAIRALEASIADYPEEADTHRVLAALLLAAGRRDAALAAYRASADVYPFDPDVQGALAELYTAAGQRALADRHAGYRRVLELGGDLPTSGASR